MCSRGGSSPAPLASACETVLLSRVARRSRDDNSAIGHCKVEAESSERKSGCLKDAKVAKERSRPRSLRTSLEQRRKRGSSNIPLFSSANEMDLADIEDPNASMARERTVVARVRAHGATHPSAGGIVEHPREPPATPPSRVLFYFIISISLSFCSVLFSFNKPRVACCEHVLRTDVESR